LFEWFLMLKEQDLQRIDEAVKLFRQSNYAVAFTGAGISTDSGIPDFRSENSGLWEGIDPMVVASIYGFRRNPQAFYDWVRPLTIVTANAEPNAAHYALATLESKGILKSIITQNIDMLHTRAGTQCIYELHGHMREATCISCFEILDGAPIMEKFIADGQVPRCPYCRGVVKPNVILFGEQLPIRELQGAQDATRKCDLMLIIGSSLEVAPASDLPLYAKRHGAKLIIVNLEPTPVDGLAEVVIHARAAQALPELVRRLENTLP
jgi:NAD-dependent deacetylase